MIRILKFLLLFWFSTSLQAFYYQGYLGYRYIKSDNGGTPVTSSPEMGIVVGHDIDKHLSLFAHVRNVTDSPEADQDFTLLYGFARWSMRHKEVDYKVSVGKTRIRYCLFGSENLNPVTKQAIIVPNAIHPNFLLESFTQAANVGASLNMFYKQFEFEMVVGQPNFNNQDVFYSFTGIPKSVKDFMDFTDLKSHDLATHFYLEWEPDIGVFHDLSIVSSFTELSPGFKTKGSNPFMATLDYEFTFTNIVTGFEYRYKPYTLSAEFGVVKQRAKERFMNSVSRSKAKKYSFTFGYHISDALAVFYNYNDYKIDNLKKPIVTGPIDTFKVIDGAVFIGETLTKYRFFRDNNIGLRYRIMENLQLKLEYHKMSGLMNWPRTQILKSKDKNRDVWATSITYEF